MTFWTRTFIPTLKETPAEAQIVSHKLLLRAGLARKVGAGIYAFLPLGWRVLRKLSDICREEMERGGAVEVHLPALHPAELWEKGPRWQAAREVMYSVHGAGVGDQPPKDPVMVLGPTHEEIITPLIGQELGSYRDLPKNFFQIQTKFRNEIRPRFGLMRAREFLMKDGYSFDATDEGANLNYRAMEAAYRRFFQRLGLKFIAVEADTGVMGGSFSHEFMVPAEVGDDDIFYCEASGYAANREKATSRLVPDGHTVPPPTAEVEEFATPGVRTIEALAAPPYGVAAACQFKTLLYVGDGKLFAVVVRGQDEVEEAKLASLGFQVIRPARPEEIRPVMGAMPGTLGVVRGTIAQRGELHGVYADHAICLIGEGVTGANRDDFHLRHVHVERDLDIDRFGDFRSVQEGEPCPLSGAPLAKARAIEVGHVFKLGTKYSERLGASFADAEGVIRPAIMGCYGIGLSRTLQAIIEQGHDENGICWPWSAAPYQILITVLDPALPEAMTEARRLAEVAEDAGADVLIDDRTERPGVKFKDADLIGIPLRLTLSARGLKEGVAEFKWRHEKQFIKVPLNGAEEQLRTWIGEASRITRQDHAADHT